MNRHLIVVLVLLAVGCSTQTQRLAPSDAILVASPAPTLGDDAEIRFAVYGARVQPGGTDLIFIAESDDFIRELVRRSGNHRLRPGRLAIFDEQRQCIVDRLTREEGVEIAAGILSIQNGSAIVRYSMYATPRGASAGTVRLSKVDGRWIIAEWRVDLIS